MRSPASVLLVLTMVAPLDAWNATGHRAIAAIAYQRLNPRARARVDSLLARHPDFLTILTRNATDPGNRMLEAVQAAAVWPDTIKGDRRFWDDEKKDAQPTPLLPGFPDMKMRKPWHYKDLPFSPDGTPLQPAGAENAITALARLMQDVTRPPDDARNPAYALPWILHISGDIHQPLHAVSRFLKDQPDGDAGGNGVKTAGEKRNLHWYWDDLPGNGSSEVLAAALTREFRPVRRRNPADWLNESAGIAQREVYTFGPIRGSETQPVVLDAAYATKAQAIARRRMAEAGYRLADLLNSLLK
ncbi:MAG: S1/P1 nuclease [Bryobacteraceae bacterium]|nr:S1/P1 nuclease [Bryobacteraceae bacterium]